MKRLSVILFIVTMLCISCTKHFTSIEESKKVNIVLHTTNRTLINPNGTVEWLNGDKIHVYHSKDGYLGLLSYNNSFFAGEITPWTEEGQLRFIYRISRAQLHRRIFYP